MPRRRLRSRPSVSLMTPYAHRRFKGPVGSPLIVSILTLTASASRSRPRRIVRFRRRAILRRFVPHPRKMANVRRLVLAKASHTRPNRRGRLAPPTAGSASRVAVSTNASVRPSLSSAKNSPTARSRLRRFGTGGPQGPCQSPPSVRAQNSAPTAGGACYARRWRGTPLASLARQPFRKSAPGYRRLHRYAAFGLPIDSTGTAKRIECHLCLHAQLLMNPLLSRMNFMRIPAQVSLHALRQIPIGVRC